MTDVDVVNDGQMRDIFCRYQENLKLDLIRLVNTVRCCECGHKSRIQLVQDKMVWYVLDFTSLDHSILYLCLALINLFKVQAYDTSLSGHLDYSNYYDNNGYIWILVGTSLLSFYHIWWWLFNMLDLAIQCMSCGFLRILFICRYNFKKYLRKI